jgi:hypothetical protein
MTNTLYITHMNKPNVPEELDLMFGRKDYSFRTDLRVNGWGYVSMALSLAGDLLLPRHPEWHVALRAMIALAPIVPALLWGRVFARWIRGMDELHRRMTIEVCLFSITATLFFFTALRPLVNAGIFQPLEKTGLDLRTWWGTSWLMVCFYILGSRVLHRRFK